MATSSREIGGPFAGWHDGDDQVLHQRLIAVLAVVSDRAKRIQLRHISGCAAARNVVRDRAIPANNPGGSVFCKTCYVNQIVFGKRSFLHIVFVHEDERAKILHSAVSVVVGVNGRIPLIVRPHRAEHELAVRRDGITERRRRKISQACGRMEDEFARWLF